MKADTRESIKSILASPWKRLNNLYWQVDKNGNKFKFKPNKVQTRLYKMMWYLNIILKARQEGMTTIIQMFLLDRCLFNSNTRAGVIAHNREDAENFFKHKIKFAYDNLPEAIRAAIPARTERAGELAFANGSSIRVGTSMRSDTLQYLHISEFGKICAKYPDKALEIISGSLNTIIPGQFVFIESTAEGAHGKFYEMCKIAEKKLMGGLDLTIMDYKFFFFAWWELKDYVLKGQVDVPAELAIYFEELAEESGIELSREQKNWYIKKHEEQGDMLMPREYPSTPEDAFRAIIEGAIFGKQMRNAYKERRILDIPIIDGIPVNTFWDLGRNDQMSVWFHQRIGMENRFIDYISGTGENIQHYIKILMNEKNYLYGKHYLPHDVEVIDLTQAENLTRKQVAERAGLRPIVTVERIADKAEAIELGRNALPSCFFDKRRCEEGIRGLENYRYEYDDKIEQFKKEPFHNWASNPADAFMQFAQSFNPKTGTGKGGGHVGMY